MDKTRRGAAAIATLLFMQIFKNKNKNKMANVNTNFSACDYNFYHIGWKYYNTIKKKAMEQEFSWSGLVLSLSIAFFIIIVSAFILSSIYKSLVFEQKMDRIYDNGLYRIESFNSQIKNTADYLNIELLNGRQIKNNNKTNLV